MLVHDLGLAVEHCRPIQFGGGDAFDPEFFRILQVVPKLGIEQERLGRNAAHMQAGAPKIGILFNQRSLQPVLSGADRGRISCGSAADYGNVVDSVWQVVLLCRDYCRAPLSRLLMTIISSGKPRILAGRAASDTGAADVLTHPFSLSYIRLGLNLHQHLWIYQRAHRNHGSCGTNFTKDFAVSASNFFPISNVGDEHSGADNVLQFRAGLFESRSNVLQRLHSLRIGVPGNDLSVRSGRCRSRNVNVWPDPYRPRVSHHRLPGSATRNIYARHQFCFSFAGWKCSCPTVLIISALSLILRRSTVFSAPAYTYTCI